MDTENRTTTGRNTPDRDLPALLLPWFQAAKRDLPWRQDRLPYHVWLSEIMLQQTRVEAVRGYYTRFLAALPDIQALADVPEEELLKLWEGLGYYNRVRNLQKAARVICDRYEGRFPEDYDAIRALPGIGDYTAGAICSICFDRPTPAVDGNVLRVITRLTGDFSCIDDPAAKKAVTEALREIYPAQSEGGAGDFTQALMELGALVCVPNGAPKCAECPLFERCTARREGLTDDLPVRAEKKKRRQETLTVLLLSCGDRIAISKRPDSGLLAGLFEFPNISGPDPLTAEEAIALAEDWGTAPRELVKVVSRRHIFTHVQWNMTGIRLLCREMPDYAPGSEQVPLLWVPRDELVRSYALPTAFRQFLPDFSEPE